MRQLIAILILSSLFSCSPERKLKRAQRKLANLVLDYPQLIKTDTIFKDTTIFLPSKEIKGEAEIDKNYSKLDSIINSYNGRLDSLSKIKLINEVKYYVTNKPILLDTIKVDSLGLHLRLFERDGKLHYTLKLDSSGVKFRYGQEVHSINPVKIEYEVHWYDIASRWVAILAILFIILDLYAGFKSKK